MNIITSATISKADLLALLTKAVEEETNRKVKSLVINIQDGDNYKSPPTISGATVIFK